MSLTAGSRLGSYEIVALLGAGGMGEVYQATDTNLKRQVAIKVLPAAVAADAERLARFQREAEVLASLNHPHIAHIHGLEKSDGTIALVMELVEGQTLADRIAQGPIPVPEALAIAKQTAEALEAAHEQGIVHRDLKPANIKVRADGTVKVLDFGLAKAMEPASASSPSLSLSPTITTPAMTQAGLILGTAAYMSPEQARGKTVDKRADIWAFGAVLFEMLTGSQPFPGEDISHVLARVIERDPDWSALPPTLPSALQTYLRRCLEKDPRQRIRDIGDVRLALEGVFETAVRPVAPLPPAISSRRSWLIAAVALVAAVSLGFAFRPRPVPAPPVLVDLVPPEHVRFQPLPGGSLTQAISRDHRYIAFRGGSDDSRSQLWIRDLSNGAERVVADSDDPVNPFWSPDNRSVGFFGRDRTLRIAEVGGGASRVLSHETPNPARGATWSNDGTILYGSPTPGGGIFRISAKGGRIEAVTTPDPTEHEVTHRWPVFLPDGHHFLYLARHERSDDDALYIADLSSKARTRLLDVSSAAVYAQGWLLYARERTLVAQRFDAASMKLSGVPISLRESLVTDVPSATVEFSVSEDGVLAHFTTSEKNRLMIVRRTGETIENNLATYVGQATGQQSPVGDDILIERVDPLKGERRISRLDAGRKVETVLASAPNVNYGPRAMSPAWSPDGLSVAFHRRDRDRNLLVVRPANGDAAEQVLVDGRSQLGGVSWSSDPAMIVYGINDPETKWDVWRLDVSTRKATPLLRSPANEIDARLSHDRGFVAFASDESGRPEIYVQGIGVEHGRWQITDTGGSQPNWRGDDRELFYLGTDRRIHAVSIATSPFRLGQTVALAFEVLNDGGYSVSADGNRFLFGRNASESASRALHLLFNWPTVLTNRSE